MYNHPKNPWISAQSIEWFVLQDRIMANTAPKVIPLDFELFEHLQLSGIFVLHGAVVKAIFTDFGHILEELTDRRALEGANLGVHTIE